MNPAVLALPNGLFRLQCHLRYLLSPSPIQTLKAFSSSLAFDSEETPAMKALKDIPYPSAPPDLSLFESWTDEYDGVDLPQVMPSQWSIGRAESSRSANRGYHASDVLERLVRRKRFAEAEEVRQELVEMKVSIRPSSAYYLAAWNVLRQRPPPPNRAEMLANWLSLLPDLASNRKVSDDFFNLTLFFNSSHVDLETIAQFGIILSSKGYIRKMGSSVVANLTRHADPDDSSRILDEMIAGDENYKRSKFGNTHYASTRQPKNTTRRLWSIAVRTHCTAGRPEVALQMAERAHERGFHLTKFTYEYLLGKLEADGLNDLAAKVRAFPFCGSLDVAKSRIVDKDIPSSTAILPISPKRSMAVNQAIALAVLKRGSRLGLPAYTLDIVPYFDFYKTHLRGDGAVDQLRARAFQFSLTALSAVFLAEQLHHHRRGEFKHVLWVFERYFHAVGVPSEDVRRQLWKRDQYPSHLRLRPFPFLPRNITKTTFNLPSKLWPTSYHTALVWAALVHLCESEEELFALYELLLQRSAQSQKPTGEHPSSISAPADRYDAAHFHPFLISFTLLRDAKYGLRVLDEMQDRGIAPSAQILSTAAALQAKSGEPALALRILDIIGDVLERDEAEVEVGLLEMEVGMGGGKGASRKQQQLLTAYTGVLRGLVDRRELVQARQVAELIHSHLGYVEGGDGSSGNARTDAALRYLRRLEVEGPHAKPEPLAEVDGNLQRRYAFLKKPSSEIIKALNSAVLFKPVISRRKSQESGDRRGRGAGRFNSRPGFRFWSPTFQHPNTAPGTN